MSLATTLSSFPSAEAVVARAGALAAQLPRGALLAGALGGGWLANRWLTGRALNNGNTPAVFDWAREIVVVTGGAGGIGAEIVKSLAREGTTVVVLDVQPLSYDGGDRVHYYRCDITDYTALQAVAARIRAEVGEPTVAVANAGICRGKPVLQASQRDIELTFAVNNLAMLWTAKTFLPAMVARNHGHFVVIASQTGYLATPGLTDYSATKAAAVAIYEGLHAEVANLYGAPAVRVSCVSPSAVDTPMFNGIRLGFGMSALRPADLGARIAALLRSGRAQHILVPGSAAISCGVRALPDWVRVAMQAASTDVFKDLAPHDPMAGVKKE